MEYNTEWFISKARAKFGDKFDYSKTDYKGATSRIIIICPKHGEYEIMACAHTRAAGGCPSCTIEDNIRKQSKTTEQFIQEAKSIHVDKFDYSETVYVKSSKKVKIACPLHGVFLTFPHTHLGGSAGGCRACGVDIARNKTNIGKNNFIKRATEIHGEKYDYSKVIYVNNCTKVTIICPEHGEFVCSPKRHLEKSTGCKVCGIGAINMQSFIKRRCNTIEWFLESAVSIHGDKYDYSLCHDIIPTSSTKMPIICKVHGVFNQRAGNHINSKQGCLKCYNENRKGRGIGGYRPEYFDQFPEFKKVPGVLYVAEMNHKNDNFLKVGITRKGGVKERFYFKSKNGTKISPIIEYHTTLFDAFQKEQELLQLLAPYRFFPNRKFGGYTECFKNKQEVLDIVNNFLG